MRDTDKLMWLQAFQMYLHLSKTWVRCLIMYICCDVNQEASLFSLKRRVDSSTSIFHVCVVLGGVCANETINVKAAIKSLHTKYWGVEVYIYPADSMNFWCQVFQGHVFWAAFRFFSPHFPFFTGYRPTYISSGTFPTASVDVAQLWNLWREVPPPPLLNYRKSRCFSSSVWLQLKSDFFLPK